MIATNPFPRPIATTCLALLLAACGPDTSVKISNSTPPSTPALLLAKPTVPNSLKVPPTGTLSFSANAKGVQIYECRAKKDAPDQFEWALKAPEADLFDAQGNKIGHHYGGPTWESADGSKIVGEMKAREPSPDANAIPWLLLNVKTHEGRGVMSRITSIQRLETTGGKAPATGADPSTLGQELRVPYTAVYYFYGSEP
jgi:hypothetical protein